MKKIRIILSFIYCRAGDLVKLTRHILDSLKGNPQFPDPTPSLDTVEKALQDFVTALSNAGGRDREMVAIKNKKQVILQQLLMELAHYVTQTCKGDKAMLIGSGFDITPERNKPKKLPPKLVVELGLPGQATTRVKRVARARAYIHQYTTDPLTAESVWTSETTIKHEHTFSGLPSGTKMWLRVIALTRDGKQVYWEPVSRIIQ